MIDIRTFAKSKSNGTGNNNIVSTSTNNVETNGVYIWGQFHDHTKNIDGDLTDVGNITANGTISANVLSGNNVNANTIEANRGEITQVTANEIISSMLQSDNAEIGTIVSEYIRTNGITALEGIVNELISTNITTENLNVTKQAHFFELIIDKIKSAGGSLILTPVDGFKTDMVKEVGITQVEEIYNEDSDQVIFKDRPFYFWFDSPTAANNLMAEFRTTAHNFKYWYSTNQNQRRALMYSTGQQSNTYGNPNIYFISPYICVDDIDTISIINDGVVGSGHAKLCAYDANLNYIQSNSVGNVASVEWTKAEGTKYVRFGGRNNIPNGQIYFNGQTEGDIVVKYLLNIGRPIFINHLRYFKVWKDNNNSVFQNADELVINAIPVIKSDNTAGLYNLVSNILANEAGENNYICGNIYEGGFKRVDSYKLYFKSNDGNRAINNMWQVNDQAICETFNKAEVGTTSQVSNKYYWALVTDVGTETIDNEEFHYIELSNTIVDGTLEPETGDEIAMLGYRGTDDLQRQSAIYIAAYNSIDSGITAPLFAQYTGINDFNLSNHRTTFISNGNNSFKGTFSTTTGDNIEDLINDVGQGAISYVHQAFADSADGQQNFSKTYFAGAKYMGFCSNHTESDTNLIYSDYTWMICKGEDGQNGVNGTSYYMISNISAISVKDNESTTDRINVNGYKLEGNSRIEKRNKVNISYNGIGTVRTEYLPLTLEPSTMSLLYADGLQSIVIEMFDDSETNIVSMLEIPIIRDGENGNDGNDGEDGQDAVNIKMIPINEDLSIGTNGNLGVRLSYNIIQIVGTSYTQLESTETLFIRFKSNIDIVYIPLSTDTLTPTYSNNNLQSNWKTQAHQIKYITVELVDRNTVLDKRVVYAALQPMVTFSITDEINATVQGHTTTLNQHTNQISTLNISLNGISATVEGHTTELENMSDDISTINQTINGISTRVTHIENDYITESELLQTANNVQINVYDNLLNKTGIDVTNGTITLDADNTTITGNLNLSNPKQGIIIYDGYNQPKISIQNDTLGNLENFDFGADKYLKSYTQTTVNTIQYSVTIPTITLGNYAVGQNLDLHDVYINTYNNNQPFDTVLTSLTYTMLIKCGNTTLATLSGSGTLEEFAYRLQDYNTTVTTAGNYTITISFTARLENNSYYGTFLHRLTLYNRTIQSNINKIATDGAVFASSMNQYNWFGSDQTNIRNGNQVIRLKDNQLERNINGRNSYSDISSTMPYDVINSLTHTATANDGMIVFSTVIGESDGARRTLTLPSPSTLAGKWYFVKNIVGSSTRVVCDNGIIAANDTAVQNYVEIEDNAQIFISCGIRWLQFYCG